MEPAVTSAPEPTDRSSEPGGPIRMALAIASIVLGVAMIAAVPSLRHSVSLVLHGNFTGLRDYIRGLGAGGVALLLALHEPRGLPFTQRCRRMDRRGGDRGTAGRRPFRD
ncbi:MAG TPA: hypothetical protein VG186_13015, partial [Solirubrobacteraceae bacterium]|nr:hypothetical protein [Solirubrobacteraceae bacterium]